MEFIAATDVIADLQNRVASRQLLTVTSAPLIPRWTWKLKPGYTGDRHQYEFSVELYNNSTSLIDQWKIELWFPSSFVENDDRSQPFVYKTDDDSNYSANAKRIWPRGRLPVFKIPYVVTSATIGQIGSLHTSYVSPKVRTRVSTASAPPWEEEISIMDIQKF